MKLNVLERLMALKMLPEKGNFITLKLVRELRETLGFTEKELGTYSVKQNEEGVISWNNEKGKEEVEIKISDFGRDLIKDCLKKLNESKKLEDKHFTLYGKFIDV